jgi:hypothetical protein
MTGMASKILNYYRMPDEESDSKQRQSSQAVDSSSSSSGAVAAPDPEDASSSDAQAAAGGGAEQAKSIDHAPAATMAIARVPRHMQQLRQASSGGGRHGGVSSVDIPKLPEGITEVLEPQDSFPFLGDIEPGANPQPALHSNLFRAPLFVQQTRPTDFLMVKVPKRSGFHFVVRRMASVFTAGQQEPLMIVPKPNRKKLSNMQQTFLMLHLTRFFTMQGKQSEWMAHHRHDAE